MFMKKNSLLILLLVFGISFCSSGSKKDAGEGKKNMKKVGNLAVMNFDAINVRPELRVAISEIIRAEIAAFSDIPYRIIEREMLNKVMQEQALAMTGIVKQQKAVKIGKVLYADFLILGRIFRSGNTYRISAKIVETETTIVKKQVLEDFKTEGNIPLGAKAVSYKLFDKAFSNIPERKNSDSFTGGMFTSIYSDAKGIHPGGKIHLKINGNKIEGYTIEDIGRADMSGTIEGNFINGYYKASYGYGNYKFQISRDGRYLIGTYYQITNGAHGDWIATRGNDFSMPKEIFSGRWNVGEHCIVKWSGDGYGYPGTIKHIKDGLYLVYYDDGDREWRLEKYLKNERIQPGDIVFGNWKSRGKYYRGRIARRNGQKIFIHYDDGDKEWTTISKVKVRF